MIRKTLLTTVALATLSLLAACGGGAAGDDNAATNAQASGVNVGGIGGSGAAAAGVNVGGIGGSGIAAASVNVGGIGGSGAASVSTAHACGLRSVNVTIAGARVNANGAADPAGPGWVDVPLAAPVRVNLLTLAAGASLPLDLSALPDGRYRQLRLLPAANDASAPLADSVVTLGGRESALAVPSAAQGGLPLAVDIGVAAGRVSTSWQNLDVCAAVAAGPGSDALVAVTAGSSAVATAD